MPQDLSRVTVRFSQSNPGIYCTVTNGDLPLAAGYGITPQEAMLNAAKQWAGVK